MKRGMTTLAEPMKRCIVFAAADPFGPAAMLLASTTDLSLYRGGTGFRGNEILANSHNTSDLSDERLTAKIDEASAESALTFNEPLRSVTTLRMLNGQYAEAYYFFMTRAQLNELRSMTVSERINWLDAIIQSEEEKLEGENKKFEMINFLVAVDYHQASCFPTKADGATSFEIANAILALYEDKKYSTESDFDVSCSIVFTGLEYVVRERVLPERKSSFSLVNDPSEMGALFRKIFARFNTIGILIGRYSQGNLQAVSQYQPSSSLVVSMAFPFGIDNTSGQIHAPEQGGILSLEELNALRSIDRLVPYYCADWLTAIFTNQVSDFQILITPEIAVGRA
jgi:flagellar motility protein MotE (MotC chaperone)